MQTHGVKMGILVGGKGGCARQWRLDHRPGEKLRPGGKPLERLRGKAWPRLSQFLNFLRELFGRIGSHLWPAASLAVAHGLSCPQQVGSSVPAKGLSLRALHSEQMLSPWTTRELPGLDFLVLVFPISPISGEPFGFSFNLLCVIAVTNANVLRVYHVLEFSWLTKHSSFPPGSSCTFSEMPCARFLKTSSRCCPTSCGWTCASTGSPRCPLGLAVTSE